VIAASDENRWWTVTDAPALPTASTHPVNVGNRSSVRSGDDTAGSHTGLTIATRIVILQASCGSVW
jgi:hypothetical protein